MAAGMHIAARADRSACDQLTIANALSDARTNCCTNRVRPPNTRGCRAQHPHRRARLPADYLLSTVGRFGARCGSDFRFGA